VAGAVNRASWRSCGARAAGFLVAGVVHRAWRSCGARGRRSLAWQARAQSLLEELLRAWSPVARGCLSRGRCSAHDKPPGGAAARVVAAQYIEPPGGAAARVVSAGPRLAAGPRLPVAWQVQYTELPDGAAARVVACVAGAVQSLLSRGRRNTQSLLAELLRAWSPLARGCLSHGWRSTQIFHTPSLSHHFVTHHLSHIISCTTFSHTIFYTPSFKHYLSHTIFHPQLCHTPSFTHNFVTPSLSQTTLTHYLSHTTLSHTIFDTPLCHTPSFTHTQLCHTTPSLTHIIFYTPSFTHNFVTHHLWHTIFHTSL